METSHLMPEASRSYSTFSRATHTGGTDAHDTASEVGSIGSEYADAAPGARIWEPKQVGKLYLVTELNTYWKEADGWASTALRTVVYIMKFSFVFVHSLCSAYLKNKEIKKQSKEWNKGDQAVILASLTLNAAEQPLKASEVRDQDQRNALEGQIREWEEKVEAYIDSHTDLSIIDKVNAWNEKLDILLHTEFLLDGKPDKLTSISAPLLEQKIRDSVSEKLKIMALDDVAKGKIKDGIQEVAEAVCSFAFIEPDENERLLRTHMDAFVVRAEGVAREEREALSKVLHSREAVAAAVAAHIGLADLNAEITRATKTHDTLRRELDRNKASIAEAEGELEGLSLELRRQGDREAEKYRELRTNFTTVLTRLEALSIRKQSLLKQEAEAAAKLQRLNEDRAYRTSPANLTNVYEEATQDLFAGYETEAQRVGKICAPFILHGEWATVATVTHYTDFTLRELTDALSHEAAPIVDSDDEEEAGGSGDSAGAAGVGGSPAGSPPGAPTDEEFDGMAFNLFD